MTCIAMLLLVYVSFLIKLKNEETGDALTIGHILQNKLTVCSTSYDHESIAEMTI